MTRLPNEPDITVRNQVNNSFMNYEYNVTKPVPVSRAYLSGPYEAYYHLYDPLNIESISAIDPKKLELAKNRRPFFEDKYFILRNQMDKNNINLMPYLGSGTLASNEVELSAVAPPVNRALGIETSAFLAFKNSKVNGISFADINASALDAFFGEDIITVNSVSTVDKIYSSKVVGGGISSWLTGIIEEGRTDEDKVWLAQRQGWGRNVAMNEYILEDYNYGRDVTSVYPNIHPRFYNPIWGSGGRGPLSFYNYVEAPGTTPFNFYSPTVGGSVTSLPSFNDYYPHHKSPSALHAINSHLAPPIYHHYEYLNSSSMTLQGSVNPTDYLTDVNCWITVTATVGTSANGIHSGGTLVNPVVYNSIQYSRDIYVNYKQPGIHRVRMYFYRPFKYSKSNYFDYSGLNGASVESIIGPDFANGRPIYINVDTLATTDGRFDSGFLYDPKNRKLIELSALSVTSTNDKFIDTKNSNWEVTQYHSEPSPGFFNLNYTYASTSKAYVSAATIIHNNTSPYCLSSEYVANAMERLSNNYWGKKSICVGIVAKLYNEGLSDYSKIYTKPTKIGMGCGANSILNNGTTSIDFMAAASALTKDYQDLPAGILGGFSVGQDVRLSQFYNSGWQCWQFFYVVGKNGSDVRSKMNYLYDSGELDNEPTEADVPEVLRKREGIAKANNIY